MYANKQTIVVSGSNQRGQLGLDSSSFPEIFNPLNLYFKEGEIKKICCGNDSTLVLTHDDKVWMFGYNAQTSVSSYNTSCNTPTSTDNNNTSVKCLMKNRNIKSIYNGMGFCFLLSKESKVYCLGNNKRGQLGIGESIGYVTEPTELFITNHSIKKISCFGLHSLFLTENNQLLVCGANHRGQLGLGTFEDQKTPFVVRIDGIIHPNQEEEEDKIIDIQTGYAFSIILTQHGDIYGSGDNLFGELGLSEGVKQTNVFTKIDLRIGKIKKVACGQRHTIIQNEAGEVFSLGCNDSGQLGLTCDSKSSHFRNNNNNTLTQQHFRPRFMPTKVNCPLKVMDVKCGTNHSIFIGKDEKNKVKVVACGDNKFGQLALGIIDSVSMGMRNIELEDWVQERETRNGTKLEFDVVTGNHHTIFYLRRKSSKKSFKEELRREKKLVDIEVIVG